MKQVKLLLQWFFDHIDFKYCLTPIGFRNVRKGSPATIGWTDIMIFGVRIVRIQRTKPWE